MLEAKFLIDSKYFIFLPSLGFENSEFDVEDARP